MKTRLEPDSILVGFLFSLVMLICSTSRQMLSVPDAKKRKNLLYIFSTNAVQL